MEVSYGHLSQIKRNEPCLPLPSQDKARDQPLAGPRQFFLVLAHLGFNCQFLAGEVKFNR